MGNPNPFYRFKPAWNFGFYPDNITTTQLLEEIYQAITAAYPGWITPGTTTLSQLKTIVANLVSPYNGYPVYGDISVIMDAIAVGPVYNWTLTVRNNGLYATDNTQEITISGTATNPGKVISTSFLNAFTIASYSGTYSPTLINEEIKIQEALECVNLNGSAVFPITYNYDSSLSVARSGLARGMDWQLSNGEINRLPIETTPRQNRRTFTLPQLTGDDTYVLSIMERIIQGAFSYVDFNTSILPVYNSFTPPDGWAFSYNYPSFTTYERVQFDFVDTSRRKFILVGRRIASNSYLWQRFVSDDYLTPTYDFLSVYTESTALPYEPNQAGRWLYNNDTYDLEFVEFTSGCYESGEFYAMPAKPGDQLQFNVVDGNLKGIINANVGLFSNEGQFIQKIGSSIKGPQNCPCEPNSTCDLTITYSIADSEWNQYLINLSQFNNGPVSVRFDLLQNGTIISTGGQSYVTPPPQWTTSDVQEQVSLLSGLTLVNSGGFYIFSITIIGALCGSDYCLKNVITDVYGAGQPSIDVFTSDNFTCTGEGINTTQFQAQITIPSKQGCYRFGLYGSTSNVGQNCSLSFTKSLTGGELNSYLQDFVTVMYSGTKRVGWQIPGLTSMYIFDGNIILPPYSPDDIVLWCNSNIPGMSANYTQGPDVITWTWSVSVPCGTTQYSMINCEVNALTDDCVNNLWTTEEQICPCSGSPTDFYLYSLSNIINIDRSDCFSTILEFWSDNNTIAQGFEYYSDWKQRVRIGLNGGGEKPIIEESLYRQSNGVHRRPQNKQDLSLDLHTDFFDLDTQLAMTDATRHPNLVWEGKPIFVNGDIEVATIQDFTTQSSFETLSQMKFQALIQGFQPKNSTCINC